MSSEPLALAEGQPGQILGIVVPHQAESKKEEFAHVREPRSPLSISSSLDPDWSKPVKLIFLLSPTRKQLNPKELAKINQHFMIFIYDSRVHGEKSLLSIPYNTAIIVNLGDKKANEWYTHQTRAIREDPQTRSVLLLDRTESPEEFLARKDLFNVHNIVKAIPWNDLPVETFLKFLLTDVIPQIPKAARCFAGLCS